MNAAPKRSSASSDVSALRARLRAAGMPLLLANEAGEIDVREVDRTDLVADVLSRSPLFTAAVGDAARRWRGQDAPRVVEVMPGVWLAPLPMTSRRRRSGYIIALILTSALVQSEHLHALCHASGSDVITIRSALQGLPPAESADVERLATLARFLHQDHARLTSSDEAVDTIGRQLAESYEEISLLFTLIQHMTVRERPERLVTLACTELHATLPYAWVGAQLGDDHRTLKGLAGRLIVAGNPPGSASDMRDCARQLLTRAHAGEAMVLEPGRDGQREEFSLLGATAIAYPVSRGEEVIGLLIAGNKIGPDRSASSVDTKLLGAAASHLAIFLENAGLYDDLHAMFLGTLEALTASIDAKDRYTCGHSRRVAHLTQQLASAIGLDERAVSRCHIAGLVHDVGKIGVPEAVLLKPGKLDAAEFSWIRKHPEIGYRILKDIPQLADILPGVLYHHERWDGGGYPHGLAGEGIPLLARLIGLADSFDAMSSTRTYRSAMSRSQVLEEIQKCAGRQFDPNLAASFVRLDFSEFDRMVRDHQARELDERPAEDIAIREQAA